MIVQGNISQQRLIKLQTRIEMVDVENIADTALEPLDHPVRRRRSRLGQAMFDVECGAQQTKFVIAAGLTYA